MAAGAKRDRADDDGTSAPVNERAVVLASLQPCFMLFADKRLPERRPDTPPVEAWVRVLKLPPPGTGRCDCATLLERGVVCLWDPRGAPNYRKGDHEAHQRRVRSAHGLDPAMGCDALRSVVAGSTDAVPDISRDRERVVTLMREALAAASQCSDGVTTVHVVVAPDARQRMDAAAVWLRRALGTTVSTAPFAIVTPAEHLSLPAGAVPSADEAVDASACAVHRQLRRPDGRRYECVLDDVDRCHRELLGLLRVAVDPAASSPALPALSSLVTDAVAGDRPCFEEAPKAAATGLPVAPHRALPTFASMSRAAAPRPRNRNVDDACDELPPSAGPQQSRV